jgi:hypothetical protein
MSFASFVFHMLDVIETGFALEFQLPVVHTIAKLTDYLQYTFKNGIICIDDHVCKNLGLCFFI